MNRTAICGTYGGRPACYCTSITEFPDMSFQFDRYEYVVSPEAYINMIPGKDESMCVFDIVSFENEETNKVVTLGLGFLRSFEVIFDLEN